MKEIDKRIEDYMEEMNLEEDPLWKKLKKIVKKQMKLKKLKPRHKK